MNSLSPKPWMAAQAKALQTGIKSLSHDELLCLISAPHRNAYPIEALRHEPHCLHRLNSTSIGEFSDYYQVGINLACKLAASLELGTRHWCQPIQRGQLLNDPHHVRAWLRTQLRDHNHEVFACMFLDSRHRLIQFEALFEGSIDSAEIYPRIVVQHCLRHNAAAVLFVHNHPSGHPEPSPADHSLTARLKQTLNLIDVRVLDHFIVADNQITSFAEHGWL